VRFASEVLMHARKRAQAGPCFGWNPALGRFSRAPFGSWPHPRNKIKNHNHNHNLHSLHHQAFGGALTASSGERPHWDDGTTELPSYRAFAKDESALLLDAQSSFGAWSRIWLLLGCTGRREVPNQSSACSVGGSLWRPPHQVHPSSILVSSPKI
jgi:hypothetical protein